MNIHFHENLKTRI